MRFSLLFVVFLLFGCGGSSNETSSVPIPSINFTASQNNQLVSKSITLNWTTNNATSCLASGDWAGTKSISGYQEIQITQNGANSFILSCTGDGGTNSSNLTVDGYIVEHRVVQQDIAGVSTNREFFIRYPQNPSEISYPVVFVFHGAGGSGQQELNSHQGIINLIDVGEFIGIFPSGFENRWNVSGETGADDVEFFCLIINELNSSAIFNTNRAYGIGISNGAGIINKIAKETDILGGIAPLISQQTEATGAIIPGIPLSVYQVNGEIDDLVPIDGGLGVAGTIFMSAQESAENWAINFNCSMIPLEAEINWGSYEVLEFTFADCLNDIEVKYFVVKNSGHNIQFKNQIDLFNQIWEFFLTTSN
ncbi:MAG: hypothetical protein CBD12_000365 [Amoebophilaceae bacterium TMED152]|nr:MAG: hypothetical protein CBD12_000365 [Amoebophilaceae bacterium TMED152]